jgi:hypothetical protein
MVSVRENSSQQNSQKQYLLRFFLKIFGYKTFVKIYLILPEILSVINSRESGFSRILKSEGGFWVPETLVEQSKTQNEHGSGTQIVVVYDKQKTALVDDPTLVDCLRGESPSTCGLA